ncbi:MAG TPA: RNA methyltransferase [Bacteroidales bacterium]|nr:RNA methyltransferase [Bacteroidales bacterium]
MSESLNTFLKQFVNENRLKLIDQKLQYRTRHIAVVLENLHQSHNASAILRTCECLGIQDIHIIENSNNFQPNDEIALGASQWLTLHNYNTQTNNTTWAIQQLKKQGYTIAATSLHTASVPIDEYPIEDKPTAFVFGTEVTGISEDIEKLADCFVSIPMVGFTESLNVSVAVGIVINQMLTRLKKNSADWMLSPDELEELELQWLRNSIKHVKLLEKHFYETVKKEKF